METSKIFFSPQHMRFLKPNKNRYKIDHVAVSFVYLPPNPLKMSGMFFFVLCMKSISSTEVLSAPAWGDSE